MKKVIALVAVMAASSSAFAGERPWYNNGQYPVRDAAVAVGQAIVQTGAAVAGAAADFAHNMYVECRLDYVKRGAHVILVGGSVGSGQVNCSGGYAGSATNDVGTLSVDFGPGFGVFEDEGQIVLAGFGTTADVLLGLLARGEIRWALGNEGRHMGLAAGVLAGLTENGHLGVPNVVAGYVWGRSRGLGASAAIGVTGIIKTGATVTPVQPPVEPQQPIQQQQRQRR